MRAVRLLALGAFLGRGRRGWWPRWRPASNATSCTSSIFTALFAALALSLRPRGRPRRQPLAGPPGLLRHRRLHRGPPRHRRRGWPFLAALPAGGARGGAGGRGGGGAALPPRPSTLRRSAPSASRWWPRSWPPTGSRSRAGRSASPASPSPSSVRWRSPRCRPSTGWRSPRWARWRCSTAGSRPFRLGRAFHAVRDNEPLASPAAIDPLQVPHAGLHHRRRDGGRGGRALRALPRGVLSEEMTVSLTRQPAGDRLPRRRRQPARRRWSAPCCSPRCPRCCAWRRRGGW